LVVVVAEAVDMAAATAVVVGAAVGRQNAERRLNMPLEEDGENTIAIETSATRTAARTVRVLVMPAAGVESVVMVVAV